jgi:hypothetical protein
MKKLSIISNVTFFLTFLFLLLYFYENSRKFRGNKVLIKRNHGRYIIETVGDQVNILEIEDRGNNIVDFRILMNKMYDINLQY